MLWLEAEQTQELPKPDRLETEHEWRRGFVDLPVPFGKEGSADVATHRQLPLPPTIRIVLTGLSSQDCPHRIVLTVDSGSASFRQPLGSKSLVLNAFLKDAL